MKLNKITQLYAFLEAVDKAKGEVYLTSTEGDQYNLKSQLSKYIAIGALLNEHGEELELYCQLPEDEPLFLQFFYNYPETL